MAKDTFNPDYLGIVDEADPALFDIEEYLKAMKSGGVKGKQDEEPIAVEEMLKALGSLEKEQKRIKGQRWYDPEGESPAEKEFKYADIPTTFDDSEPRGEYRAPPGDIPSYDEEGASIDELLEEFSPTKEEKTGPLRKIREDDLPPEPTAKVSEVAVAETPFKKKRDGAKTVGKTDSVAKKTVELSGDVFGEKKPEKTQTKKDEDPLTGLNVPWEMMREEGAEEEELPWLLGSLAAGPAMGLGKAAAKGIAGKLGSKAVKPAVEKLGSELAGPAVEETTSALPRLVEKMARSKVKDDLEPAMKYTRDVGNKFREYAKKEGFTPQRKLPSSLAGRMKANPEIDRLLRMVREGKLPAEKARQLINRME